MDSLNKLNIAYIHTGKWPSNSPSMTFTSLTAQALAKYAKSCHFFIKKNARNSPEDIYHSFFGIKKNTNLKIYAINNFIRFSNRFYYKKVFSLINKLVAKQKLNCLITRNLTFLPYLVRLKQKHNIEVFFEAHDFFSDLSNRDDLKKDKSRYAEIEREYFSQLSGVICLHEVQAQKIRAEYKNIPVILAGTGLQMIHHCKDENRKYVTYIGSLDSHKGVLNLINAAKLVEESAEVLIIGAKNPKQLHDIKKISGRNVTLLPWLKPYELRVYLAQTKIGILPLEATYFNKYLTSPLKLFDYFSFGVPVIASDLPALRSLIDEKCGLFFDGTSADLAAKINYLNDDKNRWIDFSTNVFRQAEQRLWDTRAKTIIQTLESQFIL